MIKYLQELYYYPAADTNSLVKSYPGINAIKGLLIVMIIITHSLPESMTLYFMYLFHMPVFLGISGFLLKQSAFKNGLWAYLTRITKRLIIPWLIAFAIYLPFQWDKLFSDPTDVLLYPFYHLWYIPAYILGSLVCYAMHKLKIAPTAMLITTGLFTICWYIYFRDVSTPTERQPLYWLGEKRLYCYLFFYVLGYILRNNLLQIRLTPFAALFITTSSFSLIVLCVFRHVPDYFTALPYLFFNLSLVFFLLMFVAQKPIMQHKFWLYINKHSLGIYFYHPLILMIIYQALKDPNKEHIGTPKGLLIGIATVALCLPLTWMLKKWTFSNRYMLGNV